MYKTWSNQYPLKNSTDTNKTTHKNKKYNKDQL